MIPQPRLRLAITCVVSAWSLVASADDPPRAAAPAFTPPEVTDPMLAPPEAAPAEIHSWDEALAMIRRAPDFLTSADAIERARGERRIALAAVLPTLDGALGYVHNFNTLDINIAGLQLVSPPPTVWSAGATFSWDIINPRAAYGVGTADLNVAVSNLSLADRRRVLAANAVSAMLMTLSAGRVAELDRVGLRAALERLTLTQTRLQFSRGTQLDLDRAQQDVAAARALVIGADESLREAREELGRALGSPTPIAAPADLDLDGFERAITGTCHLGKDIEARADVAAARTRVTVAERAVTDAKLRFSPSLNVSSQAVAATASTLGPERTWEITAVIKIPFYDGGVRYGALREAKAATDQAVQALASLRIDAMIESARAAREIAVDTASRDVAKQQRDLSASIDHRTREGYATGIGTSLDLVTSAQALRQAEINLAVLDFHVAQARADAILVNAECVY